jgi:hypothetical protein
LQSPGFVIRCSFIETVRFFGVGKRERWRSVSGPYSDLRKKEWGKLSYNKG